jgi:hypothetical protein
MGRCEECSSDPIDERSDDHAAIKTFEPKASQC